MSVDFEEVGDEDDWQMGAPMEPFGDLFVRDGYICRQSASENEQGHVVIDL